LNNNQANANAKRENRRLVKKLEQYKEEIQELMEKHEKMQKQNSQLRNDLMLLKEKRFSPEDRYVPPPPLVPLLRVLSTN
jgi:predicted nuclease with TOPRIM domain